LAHLVPVEHLIENAARGLAVGGRGALRAGRPDELVEPVHHGAEGIGRGPPPLASAGPRSDTTRSTANSTESPWSRMNTSRQTDFKSVRPAPLSSEFHDMPVTASAPAVAGGIRVRAA